MPGPIAAALGAYAVSGGISLLDGALGSPFALWQAEVAQDNAGILRHAGQRGNFKTANVMPSPDVLFSAWRRGLLSTEVACSALLSVGVTPSPEMMEGASATVREFVRINSRLLPSERTWYGRLWGNVAYMGMSRPSAADIARLSAARRLTTDQTTLLRHGLDADWRMLNIAASNSYNSPTIDDVIQQRRLNRSSFDDFTLWSARAGWTNADALDWQYKVSRIPSLGECMLARWRNAITPEQFERYRLGLGYVEPVDWQAVERANLPMPGPSDLVRFALREVWDAETVERWGYDDEFPEEFASWMGWQGLNWGADVTLPDGTVRPSLPWPKAYWRAHWQIISPSQAYFAYRMLRENRLSRYRAIAPDVTPFTQEDLNRVLRVSDYPPKMRAWLAAISTVPMSLAMIRNGFLRGTIPYAEAINQLLDRGYVNDDAKLAIETWRAQEAYREQSPVRAFRTRLHTAAFTEAAAAYREGVIDRTAFGQRLLALGASQADTQRAVALADSQNAREELRETLAAIRRAFLQGAIAPADLPARLRSLGLSAESQARYRRRWIRQRSLTRRMLSTAQLLSAVASGALPQAIASLSLANLGWNQPDSVLLLSQAGARFDQLQARRSQQFARQAKATQRERIQALRQAESAARRLRAQLRSITPLTALRRWLSIGIRSGEWVRRRLALMGYDTSSIEAYLSQWVMENERAPHPEAPAVEGTEKLARRQTSRGTIASWWKNGVVSDRWARSRLSLLGYDHGTVERYISEWRATLGKKPGPAHDEQPTAAPHTQGRPPGPRELHTEAREVHTEPRRAGP